MDSTKWNVVLDGSLSKAHMADGYYPVEVVTPIIPGDNEWPFKLDQFWNVLLANFQVLLDTTSGTHIHISWAHGRHSLDELRDISKAVVF
ncbi:hypothetical protein HDV57DRAFT_484762 [Trichoderma longibrachiatum]